jgi:Na+-driven multidrug efflux pump
LYFELALAVGLFLFMTFGTYWLFAALVDSNDIFYRSLEYMDTRKYGVFASYVGVAFVALYTGIARPNFVVVVTVVLAVVNIVLNRVLIFGGYGFPEMGIAGAGLASTIAEYVSTFIFIIYVLLDRKNRIYKLFRLPPWDTAIIRQIVRMSVPIVAMSVVGLGSSFIFFGLIENFGEQALAEANLVRIAYLVLAIPCWGFSSGTNTIISYFMGKGRRAAVIPLLWKTTYLCLGVTVAMALPLILFPNKVLYPLLGDERTYLINAAYPTMLVLFGILIVFTFGSIFFNGLIGTGETTKAMRIQMLSSVGYMGLIFLVVNSSWGSLPLAWGMEIIYWAVIFFFSFRLLHRK